MYVYINVLNYININLEQQMGTTVTLCVCTYVCMYVCTVCMHACMHICMYEMMATTLTSLDTISTRSRKSFWVVRYRQHKRINIRTYICMYVCMYVYLNKWRSDRVLVRLGLNTLIGCMYVCIYVCMYIPPTGISCGRNMSGEISSFCSMKSRNLAIVVGWGVPYE